MIEQKRRIIWTRSADDFAKDKALFGSSESKVLHLPCLSSKGLSGRQLSPALQELSALEASFSKKAVIFTSWRAIHFSLQHPELRAFMHQARLFCFGEKTRSYLAAKHFVVESFAGIRTASEIPNVISNYLDSDTFVLLPGPLTRAFDLESALNVMQFQAKAIHVYHSVPCLFMPDFHPPSEEQKSELIATLCGVICFASPSAVDGFVDALAPQNNRLSADLHALALGETTATRCRLHFHHVHVAEQNDLKIAFAKALVVLNDV